MEQPQEEPTKPKITQKFSKFPLYSNETPVYRKKPNQVFVGYGKYNDYPDYLAYLYNNSGIHNAIVKGKSAYVFGKGWQIKKEWVGNRVQLETVLKNINSKQTADELTKKKIFEKTLYGGAAYLIEWGPFGKPLSIKLQPFNTVRTNLDKTEFYISKEWTREMSAKSVYRRGINNTPPDMVTLPAFDLQKRVGKQILYLIDENPASDIYPLPEYEAGKTSIETDIECGFFHLNNVKTGFAAGTMVTFFNGVQENEQAQAQFEQDFKGKATGSDNGGEVLLNFQMPGSTAPEIKPLRSNELDKQYEQLAKDVMTKTLVAHRVSNPLLFGIVPPSGFSDNGNTMEKAWEHFCNTYVTPKQEEEEEDMNYLLTLYGIQGNPMELTVLDPVGIELSTETIMSVLNQSEKRRLVLERLGIEPIVEVLPPAVVPPINKAFAKFTEDMILSKFINIGEDAELFEVVKEVGHYEEFTQAEDDEKIIKALKDNPKISVSSLAEKTGLSEDKIYKTLDRLNASNILAVKYIEKGGEVIIDVEDVNPPDKPSGVELLTKWKYAGPKDSKNREFCKRMLNANRLYDRKEIEQLQNDAHTDGFNEDVWKYKGGWYHDPVRDVNVPQCRHYWQNIIVRRKKA